MKTSHEQEFGEENVEVMLWVEISEKSERQTCQCRRRGYFKEYIQPLQMVIGAVGLRGVASKKDEFFLWGYCECKYNFLYLH